jgi:hypothetical protein
VKLRALILCTALALGLGGASTAEAGRSKSSGRAEDRPDVVERAITLSVKDRMSALALVEQAAADKTQPENVAWAALYAGELRRMLGDRAIAKAWFQQVTTQHADSGLKDAATLGIALINAEDTLSGNTVATLQLIADKNVPDSMNADRYRVLARDAFEQGSNPTKVREYVKKALQFAEGDPAIQIKVRGSLADLLSSAQLSEATADGGPVPVNNEQDAILRIREALKAHRPGEAQRQAEAFLTTWPTSARAAEVKLLLKRAASGDKAEAGRKDEGAGDEAAAELALGGGEDVVGDIGVHVGDEGVELHALALRDGAAERADAVADLKILVEPVLGVPDRQGRVIGRHGGGVGRVDADGGGAHLASSGCALTGVAGREADSKAASARAMVYQASSTDVTRVVSSPDAKRCRLLMVPMKAWGNHFPESGTWVQSAPRRVIQSSSGSPSG